MSGFGENSDETLNSKTKWGGGILDGPRGRKWGRSRNITHNFE